jgi:hypothetical protein
MWIDTVDFLPQSHKGTKITTDCTDLHRFFLATKGTKKFWPRGAVLSQGFSMRASANLPPASARLSGDSPRVTQPAKRFYEWGLVTRLRRTCPPVADGGALEISGIFCLPLATIKTIIRLVAQGISNHRFRPQASYMKPYKT